MQFSLQELSPAPRFRSAEDLPGGGRVFGRKRRLLSVQPDEVAIVSEGGELRVLAPDGSQSAAYSVEVSAEAAFLLLPREMSATLVVDGVPCDGGNAQVGLWGTLRFIGSSGTDHRLLALLGGQIQVQRLYAALGDASGKAFGDLLTRACASVQYRPGVPPAALQSAFDSGILQTARKTFADSLGMAWKEAPQVQSWNVPDVDDLAALRRERQVRDEQRREKLQEDMKKLSVDTALESARRQKGLTSGDFDIAEAKQELEKEIIEAKKRTVRAQPEIEAELQAEHVRRTKLDNELREAAIAGQKAETERLKAEKEEVEARRAALEREMLNAEQTRAQIEVLTERMEALTEEVKGDKSAEEDKPELGLAAQWSAYNDAGVVMPRLDDVAELRSGLMLDVAVTTTLDAYVYILLKGSGDKWQILLPDRDRIMGVEQKNLQKAGEAVTWPGINTRRPDRPYWALDNKPGLESVAVVASVDPLDAELDRLLLDDDLSELRRAAKATGTRGIQNPADNDANTNAGRSGGSYHSMRLALFGKGCVMHETVIRHV